MENNLKIQSPWQTYFNKIKAIFGDDPDIEIPQPKDAKDGQFIIDIDCSSTVKALALDKLLKHSITMGNITVKVMVNDVSEITPVDLDTITAAFERNPHFKDATSVETPAGAEVDFCIMNKEVIQFFNDDLTDIYGNFNGLAEDILREITVDSNINFCTADE